MTEHPILFSGEMVRAILDGRKTQTRRVMKPQPELDTYMNDGSFCWVSAACKSAVDLGHSRCLGPYGVKGDRLYVREAWAAPPTVNNLQPSMISTKTAIVYRADGERNEVKWRPSIHMPRWMSRITLEVTDVRIERIQDIDAADALYEGIEFTPNPGSFADGPPPRPKKWDEWSEAQQKKHAEGYARATYISRCDDVERIFKTFTALWDSINGDRGFGWDKNPFCWVVEFKRLTP